MMAKNIGTTEFFCRSRDPLDNGGKKQKLMMGVDWNDICMKSRYYKFQDYNNVKIKYLLKECINFDYKVLFSYVPN